jgi:hypothetical protein
MFRSHWFDLDGSQLAPFRGREVAEAHRIWREHSDIRLAPVATTVEDLFGMGGGRERPQEAVSRVPVPAKAEYLQLGLSV